MQHRSPGRYRLDHRGQLLGYTHPYANPLLLWIIPQPSEAMGAKRRVRPAAHWTEEWDRVVEFACVTKQG